ncbi:OX-2 membrane glycoprotein-like [Anableps anableps]
MRHAAVIRCLFISSFLHTGVSRIETQQTVWAAVGEDARLSCQLTEAKDVLQVTWQKVLPDGEKNLATYTKKFGSRVRADLEETVDFQCEDLQSCSMVIRKVTEQDEGCYRCLFNTYPEGALIGRTCLRLYELHGPFVDVRVVPPGSAVSCSATGRPAPTVTLTGPQQKLGFSHYNATSVTNANGTVTVTTTALLSAPSSTQVGCSVSVGSAAPRELLVTVAGLTSADGLDEEPGSDNKSLSRSLIIAVVLLCGFLVVLSIILCFNKLHKNRKLQRNKTPEKQTINTQAEDHLILEKNNEKRTAGLINRQTSKQQLSPVSPTTPDVESCLVEGVKLHRTLTAKKSV